MNQYACGVYERERRSNMGQRDGSADIAYEPWVSDRWSVALHHLGRGLGGRSGGVVGGSEDGQTEERELLRRVEPEPR